MNTLFALCPRLPRRGAALLALLPLFAALPLARAADPGDVDANGAINLVDVVMIKDHLLERSPLTGEALARADGNQDGDVDLADVVWTAQHRYPEEITIYLPGDAPMVFVRIPAGSFQMGSPDGERGHTIREAPVHTVNITSPFFMGKYEVTQKQWLAVMGGWPGSPPTSSYGLGDNYPAYYISWNDCQNFITALNQHIANTEQGPATFRLPSEAEWEYACRAGTQTRFFFGDSLSVDDGAADGPAGTLPGNRSDYMWFAANNWPYGSKPIGTKLPNQFGLCDMSGNVSEWCQDYSLGQHYLGYTGAPTDGSAWLSPTSAQRRARGGNWFNHAFNCRSAGRYAYYPDDRYAFLGARFVRTQ